MINKFQININCYGLNKTKKKESSLHPLIPFVMMQDGKLLPDGPVVISPDGLFPSLYREGNLVFIYFLYENGCGWEEATPFQVHDIL